MARLPAASALITGPSASSTGKFQGAITPTTPSGTGCTQALAGCRCKGVATRCGLAQRLSRRSACCNWLRSGNSSVSSVTRAERWPKSDCTAAQMLSAPSAINFCKRSSRSRRTSKGVCGSARLAARMAANRLGSSFTSIKPILSIDTHRYLQPQRSQPTERVNHTPQ